MGISAGVINQIIKDGEVDTNLISDGYHTFAELYEHRCLLFIALCRMVKTEGGHWTDGEVKYVWRSKLHSDGTGYDGWFIMGIGRAPGHQITYHLPMRLWDDTEFANTLDLAPEWDGHTSAEALGRIAQFWAK